MSCITGNPSCSIGKAVLPGKASFCILNSSICAYTKHCNIKEPDLLNDMDYDTGAFVYTVKFFPYIINRIMNLITRIRANALCLRDLDCKVRRTQIYNTFLASKKSHPKEGYICTSYRMISNKRRGTCVHGLSFYHNSYSPGMEYDPKKRVFRVANNALGTWTSPVYVSPLLLLSHRIFSKANNYRLASGI